MQKYGKQAKDMATGLVAICNNAKEFPRRDGVDSEQTDRDEGK